MTHASPSVAPAVRRPPPLLWLLAGVLVARRGVHPRTRTEGRSEPDADNPGPQAAAETDRGRAADAPQQIPPKGWKDILFRTWKEVGADDVPALAQSIAFAGILAVFPALAAFVSVYGLFADVATAREHMAALTGIVPASAMTFLGEQMVRIAAQKNASLSLTFVFGLLLSIWSANAGMKSLFKGLNVAYEETEKRGFLRLNLTTLVFTIGTIAFVSLAMAAMVVLPVVTKAIGLGFLGPVLSVARWPLLLVLAAVGLSVLYRFGPSRDRPRWRWVTWGSATSAVLWMAGSLLFSWYLANFAHYNETYGSLGAVFGFMMWLWLSALIVLFGAELNSEMEHQTAADTTEGQPRPMGARGAEVADTLGASQAGRKTPKKGRPPQG